VRDGLRPALRLAAALAWLAVIVLARGTGDAPPSVRLLDPLAGLVASLTQAALHAIGIAAQRAGTVLFVPGGFAYDITVGCTGLLPAVVLAAAILASPGTLDAKRRGLSVGVPLVLAVNLLRLVHLFYLGIHAPRVFVLAHSLVWEATLVLCTFVTWLVWTRWAARRAGQGGGGGGDGGARLARPLSS
jgi:exosortase/archaeosortase family protein